MRPAGGLEQISHGLVTRVAADDAPRRGCELVIPKPSISGRPSMRLSSRGSEGKHGGTRSCSPGVRALKYWPRVERIDGKAATAHWGDIDRLQRIYPRVHWQRRVRYGEGGTLLSTAGLTAGGVDATRHLLARRHGAAVVLAPLFIGSATLAFLFFSCFSR
jgi:hypothetical protein